MTIQINENVRMGALNKVKEAMDFMLDGKLKEAIEASNQGIIVMYEFSEIMDSNPNKLFKEDPIFFNAMYENFFEGFIDSIVSQGEYSLDEVDTAEKLSNEFYEYQREAGLVFYRFKDSNIDTYDKAISKCKDFSYWQPIAIIVDGEYKPTRHLGDAVYF